MRSRIRYAYGLSITPPNVMEDEAFALNYNMRKHVRGATKLMRKHYRGETVVIRGTSYTYEEIIGQYDKGRVSACRIIAYLGTIGWLTSDNEEICERVLMMMGEEGNNFAYYDLACRMKREGEIDKAEAIFEILADRKFSAGTKMVGFIERTRGGDGLISLQKACSQGNIWACLTLTESWNIPRKLYLYIKLIVLGSINPADPRTF